MKHQHKSACAYLKMLSGYKAHAFEYP